MNKIKLKYNKDFIIYHVIERFLGGNLSICKGITVFNNINNCWKYFFTKKYSFFNIGDKYKSRIDIEKDNEKIEKYIYWDLEGQELIDMMNFLYEEIFSLEILPGNPEYFGENYWGNNTSLFHNIVGQIDYRKLKIGEIDELKEIIKRNYKRAKVSEYTYKEVLRKLDRRKKIAIRE